MELLQTETFKKWRQNITDSRLKKIVATRLFRLAHGLAGDAKPVGGGISELRIDYGKGYRVYYQQRGNTIIVLLCAGHKGTQNNDIKLAKKLVKEV